jgi:deoxyribonuclease IV
MQWHVKPLTDDEVQRYRHAWQITGKGFPVLAHNSYLINLGSPDAEKLEKSRKAFRDELDRAERLGIRYVVFHPGSHLNESSVEKCIQTIADSLNLVVEEHPGYQVQILIENTAGQGSNIGWRFEHIAGILEALASPERFGVCMDTCHTLAAGYDIRTAEGFQQVLEEFDRIVGLRWIKAFHLNDSKKPLGSRVDRHENIGIGCVGIEAFRFLVNEARFANTPMVLETPGGDEQYRKNLETLRELIL